MLFKRSVLEGIARGEITFAFRRWKRPTVSPNRRLRTALGEVRIGAVIPMDEAALDEDMARRAGFASLEDLRRDLREGAGLTLYRIELLGIDADRRVTLRESTEIDTDEAAVIRGKLASWDGVRGKDGYHRQILELLAMKPGTAAGQLSEQLGVEKLKFKRDVRKLKELGLTESMNIGYRLSPRGTRFLQFLGETV